MAAGVGRQVTVVINIGPLIFAGSPWSEAFSRYY
jgi:hypothetical protein